MPDSVSSLERLLDDLVRYANEHPDYAGTLDRGGADNNLFSLRYFTPHQMQDYLQGSDSKTKESARTALRKHNDGVRKLDTIAGRILEVLTSRRIVVPEGNTKGASVMAWVLSDQLGSPSRSRQYGGFTATSNAFESIRERLLDITSQAVEPKGARRGKQIKYTADDRVALLYKNTPESIAWKASEIAEAVSSETSPVTADAVRQTPSWKKARNLQKELRASRKRET